MLPYPPTPHTPSQLSTPHVLPSFTHSRDAVFTEKNLKSFELVPMIVIVYIRLGTVYLAFC